VAIFVRKRGFLQAGASTTIIKNGRSMQENALFRPHPTRYKNGLFDTQRAKQPIHPTVRGVFEPENS
jgi:hypothetical protein